MKMYHERSVIGFALTLFSNATLATQLEDWQTFDGWAGLYAFLLFTIVPAVCVYFMRPEDVASLPSLYDESNAIHSVGPDALVMDCVRKMIDKKILSMNVMNGEKLIGTFTERDALSRVLSVGRDPRITKVFEVMTKDPYYVSPTTTVVAAIESVSGHGETDVVVPANFEDRRAARRSYREVQGLAELAIWS